MMKRTAVAVALAATLGSIPVAAAPDATAQTTLRQLNDREVAAFLASDTATLATLWSDSFVVTNPLNRFLAKPQVLGMTASGFVAMSALTRTIDYIHVYDNVAVVAGSEAVTWAGTFPLAGKTSQLRFTAVWRDEAGTWREVARHANIVPDPR